MTDAITALGDVGMTQATNVGGLDLARKASLTGQLTGQAGVGADAVARASKAAKEFEAMFMSQMLQPMFEGIETDSMFGGGHGEDVMRGFLVQEYGKAMAQGINSPLSDALTQEILRLQTAASGGKPDGLKAPKAQTAGAKAGRSAVSGSSLDLAEGGGQTPSTEAKPASSSSSNPSPKALAAQENAGGALS